MGAKSRIKLAGNLVKEARSHPNDTSVFDLESGKLVGRTKDGRVLSSDTDKLLAALLSKERLRILNVIADKPLRISQIAEATGMEWHAVCFHTGVLEEAGLISSIYEVLKAPTKEKSGRAGHGYQLNVKRYGQGLTELQKLVIADLPGAGVKKQGGR